MHYSSDIVVVFDGYSDNTKNIKAMEQLRRTTASSTSYEVCFDETMIVPISQEKFLSNPCNKKNFISMLIKQLKTVNPLRGGGIKYIPPNLNKILTRKI